MRRPSARRLTIILLIAAYFLFGSKSEPEKPAAAEPPADMTVDKLLAAMKAVGPGGQTGRWFASSVSKMAMAGNFDAARSAARQASDAMPQNASQTGSWPESANSWRFSSFFVALSIHSFPCIPVSTLESRFLGTYPGRGVACKTQSRAPRAEA